MKTKTKLIMVGLAGALVTAGTAQATIVDINYTITGTTYTDATYGDKVTISPVTSATPGVIHFDTEAPGDQIFSLQNVTYQAGTLSHPRALAGDNNVDFTESLTLWMGSSQHVLGTYAQDFEITTDYTYSSQTHKWTSTGKNTLSFKASGDPISFVLNGAKYSIDIYPSDSSDSASLGKFGHGTQVKAEVFATPVPEPSTIIAGALLLLPFGLSSIRILRKNRV